MSEYARIIGSKLSAKELEEIADKMLDPKQGSEISHALELVQDKHKEEIVMARKPVGGEAPALNTAVATEFNPNEVKFMNVGSAASRDLQSQMVANITTKATITGDVLKRLVKVAQACIEADKGFTLTVYPNDRLSEAQQKYYNGSAKINIEHLENEGIITRAEIYAD